MPGMKKEDYQELAQYLCNRLPVGSRPPMQTSELIALLNSRGVKTYGIQKK